MSHEATLLVVDDEAPHRFMVARLLAGAGYRVLEAENGLEALRLVEEASNGIRLVIADLRMPVMNGYELAERLTTRPVPMPMVFISGYRQSSTVLPGPVFMKPFSTSHLLEEIRRLLTKGSNQP
jgi:two-component system, cell cycle sensor histidine kinase and response regulator CckA